MILVWPDLVLCGYRATWPKMILWSIVARSFRVVPRRRPAVTWCSGGILGALETRAPEERGASATQIYEDVQKAEGGGGKTGLQSAKIQFRTSLAYMLTQCMLTRVGVFRSVAHTPVPSSPIYQGQVSRLQHIPVWFFFPFFFLFFSVSSHVVCVPPSVALALTARARRAARHPASRRRRHPASRRASATSGMSNPRGNHHTNREGQGVGKT